VSSSILEAAGTVFELLRTEEADQAKANVGIQVAKENAKKCQQPISFPFVTVHLAYAAFIFSYPIYSAFNAFGGPIPISHSTSD